MGNLRSVFNALVMVGGAARIVADPSELSKAERIVLPGVGSFADCIGNLGRTGFQGALNREVRERGKPILGICLGMQVMADGSEEFGRHKGLGWFAASVLRIIPNGDSGLRVPQVGWNDIEYVEHPMFAGLPSNPDFYFVHSFQMQCEDPRHVVAVCDYGGKVTAAVAHENIFATQFHPEKSQDFGLQLLRNFLAWRP